MTGTAEEAGTAGTILRPGLNCLGIFEVEKSGLIIDACAYYHAFYHAAKQARHYIAMAGWQFDTEVSLLRGRDAEGAGEDVRLLPFLVSLCNAKPELRIYILAWDFSVLFAMEREWFQDIIFNWSGTSGLNFRFDNSHPVGATHHQKFIVIDGVAAFAGGMDICSDRWDDCRHLLENPERVNGNGAKYDPYHDIQTYHTGEVVRELAALFRERWLDAGGDEPLLATAAEEITLREEALTPLSAARVAISRTRPKNLQTLRPPVLEIRRLFLDAIAAADELIYMENQYFSSEAMYWALVDRMTAEARPRLQVVLMLPGRLPLTEELFLGLPQMKMLRSLQKLASRTGHAFGVYSSACIGNENKIVFIHSKLLLVDDRFLTVGSANATNRSMGLDTELNVSWEAVTHDGLAESIRRVRASLLTEHTGAETNEARKKLEMTAGLVDHLNVLALDPETRLCFYAPELPGAGETLTDVFDTINRVVDPEKPFVEELVYEYFTERDTSFFLKGILLLSRWLTPV